MRKYNKIFYNKGIKYSKQKQIETKIFLIASLDIHKLQRNLLVASKTGSVTCGEPEQRAVAIAQKTVIVLQGVLVEITPPLADTCCYQQKQRALGLVEVGDDRLGIRPHGRRPCVGRRDPPRQCDRDEQPPQGA